MTNIISINAAYRKYKARIFKYFESFIYFFESKARFSDNKLI